MCWACYFKTSRLRIPTKRSRISKTFLLMSILVLGSTRMLFRELWSVRAPMWTSCFSFIWVEQNCICRTPISYFSDALLQLSINSSYIMSKSRKSLIISKQVTINFTRWNAQRKIIYVNTEEKRSQKRPLWNSNVDTALRWIMSSNKCFCFLWLMYN